MKKSGFGKKTMSFKKGCVSPKGRPPFGWFGIAGSFTIIMAVFGPPPAAALAGRGGGYNESVISQTNYIDKYFTIDQSGQWQMNIYLGDSKIATMDNRGNVNYLLTDHLDSVVSIVDPQGKIMEYNDYLPFGEINYSPIKTQSYKFAGQENDVENSLSYFTNRYYSTSLGRFMSFDPMLIMRPDKNLSDPQQLNFYAYARQNPLSYLDANGLETRVFIEKNNNGGFWDAWYGHAFVGIDGTIYNWDYNAGRKYDDNDDRYAGEDIDITTWENYGQRLENKDKEYQVYSFDTSKAQEREIRRFYLDLAEKNGAEKAEDRFLYSLFYNGTDAVVDALKQGGIINPDFSAGKLVSRASNLQKALDFRLAVQERGRPDFWAYYQRFYSNKVKQKIINKHWIN